MSKHTEHLVKGQWICDNNECRQKLHQQIEKLNDELKNDFQKIFRENSSKSRVDENRGWKIVRSIGEKLSKTLPLSLKNDQIVSIVDEFGEDAFCHEFRFELEIKTKTRRSVKINYRISTKESVEMRLKFFQKVRSNMKLVA